MGLLACDGLAAWRNKIAGCLSTSAVQSRQGFGRQTSDRWAAIKTRITLG